MSSRSDLHASLQAFAASGLSLTPALAGAMLRTFDRLGRRRSAHGLPALTNEEHEALQCTAAGWPLDRVAAHLHLPAEAVQAALAQTVTKLDRIIDPGSADRGSGDRAPRPKPPGGLADRAVARSLPADAAELLARVERFLCAFPADWDTQPR